MTDVTLWPPLDEIRRTLGLVPDGCAGELAVACPADVVSGPGGGAVAVATDVPDTLRALIERRSAVARLPRPPRWQSGDIVGLPAGKGVLLGVLLDEPDAGIDTARGLIWRGWVTGAEVDWAGAHDLVLEPQDEPFDPAVGLIQTWNQVWVEETRAPLLGRLTAARLAAVRAVQDEYAADIEAHDALGPSPPGCIGLRTVGGFTVLTGTALGDDDPRTRYRAIYRDVAQRLTVPRTQPVQQADRPPGQSALQRLWHGLRDMWPGTLPVGVILTGACAAALVFSVRGLYDAPSPSMQADDEVRFRSLPVLPPRAELSVRWRDSADAREIAVLLRSFGGEIVGGPNAAGRWQVRVPDVAAAQRAMLASPLVAEVVSP